MPTPGSVLTPEDFIPELEYDAELSLEEINHDFWLALQKLEPYGIGNQTPTFVARNAKLIQPARVLKEKHLKLRAIPADPNANWRPLSARARRAGMAHGRTSCRGTPCWRATFSTWHLPWTTTSIPTSAACS